MAGPVIITLDGPSGSGKGTISQLVAKHFGYHLLDSGSLYRLTALAAIKQSISLGDEEILGRLSSSLEIMFRTTDFGVDILLNNEIVSDQIRSEEIGMAASQIAKLSTVRASLLQLQRSFAKMPGLVADGRDMGTVVFPDARFKFYLTASAEARADRRCAQLAEKGFEFNWDRVVADIKERDDRDMNRALSPLKPADDAIYIDSTDMPIGAVLQKVIATIEAN